jgi:hypothetical protein
MKTRVTAPATWVVDEGRGGQSVLRAPTWPAGAAADVGLVLYPLWQLPDPPSAQVTPFVERDLPPGTRAKVTSRVEGKTRLGAPTTLVEADVLDHDARLVERRLCAVYQFLEYGGGAMVRARNPARLVEHRAELDALLATATPDFTGHIAALEQLYAGLTEEGSWARS